MAIWHVDELGDNSNEQMSPDSHYECSLVQADGKFDLEHNLDEDADDFFASPTYTKFGAATKPASKWWDNNNSGLEVANISASGATMNFDLK